MSNTESETQKDAYIYVTSKNRQNYSDADKSQNSGSLWGCGVTCDAEGTSGVTEMGVLCVSLGGCYG